MDNRTRTTPPKGRPTPKRAGKAAPAPTKQPGSASWLGAIFERFHLARLDPDAASSRHARYDRPGHDGQKERAHTRNRAAAKRAKAARKVNR